MIVEIEEEDSSREVESQETKIYSTQNSQASALYVTQIATLLERGDRKRTLAQFNQFRPSSDNLLPLKVTTKGPLHVLVQASDRLKDSNFRGVVDTSKKVRQGKQHLKFPLYLDEQIGLTMENAVVKAQKLIDQSADEDYETD